MLTGRIKFSIESLELIQPKEMWAAFFINPTIALLEWYKETPFPIDVNCERVSSPSFDLGDPLKIEIGWKADTFPNSQRLFQTIQREVIVEYSAVAVAFLLVTEITNCRITEVTLRGDKADYFLNNRQAMLEISGTENAKSIKSRHKQKCEQLLANPYQIGGYVVVCCFANQLAHFSYHLPQKDT
jgi:hypothetical protein